MSRRLGWSDVRGGLIAVAAIVALSAVTLKFARVGALRGDTIRLYALVQEARGLLEGSEVWLSGQKVGRVAGIQFRSPTIADTSARLAIELEVMERYREAMHRDAEAQVRSGGSVIGAVVVYLSPGTAAAPIVRDGDTLRARPQADRENATAQLGAAARELPAIMRNVKEIRGELVSGRGTVGALLTDRPSSHTMDETRARLAELRARLSDRRGSIGRILNGDLGARAQRVMARADSVRALLASSNTSLGRFRRDSTLLAEVADIRDELAVLRTMLDEPRGTLGRMGRDSAIADALGDVHREMGLLVADIKKNPLRYIAF